MQRTLNWKFLLWTVGTLIVFALAIHVVHGLQVRQSAVGLLKQAERAEAGGDIGKAAILYSHYLAYQPQDVETEARLALVLDRSSRTPGDWARVASLLDEVLQRDSTRTQLRYRLVINQIQLGSLRDAIANLQILIPASTDKAELEHMLGWCQEAVGDYAKAAAAFKRTIALEPTRQASYVLLAEILRDRLDQTDYAGEVMDALVAANGNSYRAYLARFNYLRARVAALAPSAANVAQADRDLNQALQLGPRDLEVLLAAADWQQAKGDLAKASDYVRIAWEVAPRSPAIIKAKAAIAMRAGRRADAIVLLTDALKDRPKAFDLEILLIDLLIDDGKLAEAAAKIEDLIENETPPAQADYLRGRVAIARGQWSEALSSLEKARTSLGTNSEWSSRLHALLGQCYHHLGDLEQELTAFRRAVAQEPGWTLARFGLGSALLHNGFWEDGIAELEALRQAADAPPQLWVTLTRALIARNLRIPEAQRQWSEISKLLDQASANAPDTPEVTWLRAAALSARKDYVAAKTLLETACAAHPRELALWTARADLAIRQQHWSEAAGLLDQGEKTIGDSAELRLARSRVWGTEGTAEARRRLITLTDNLDRFGVVERTRVLRELAATWARLGDSPQAASLWRRLGQEQPRDLGSRFALFEIAIHDNDFVRSAHWLAELHALEGEGGKYWMFGTALSSIRQKPDEAAVYEQARVQLEQLARRNQHWDRIPLLQAAIEETDGNLDKATAFYTRAIDLGANQTRDVSRALTLLMRFGRFLDAERLLHKVEDDIGLSPELLRLGAEIALGNQNGAEALRLAERAFSPASVDYRDYTWLGTMYHAAGADGKAEQAFRRALALAPHTPDTWIALVQQLTRTNQRQAAKTIAEQAKAKIAPQLSLFTEARCLESMGLADRAADAYRLGLVAQADDFALLSQAANFYLHIDQPARAEPFLARLLDLAVVPMEYLPRARRQLAWALAAQHQGDRTKALALIDGNLRTSPKSVLDLRMRALIQAIEPLQRRQAIRVFEESERRLPLSLDEQLALADLYGAAGDQARARERLLGAVTQQPENPQVIAHYIRALLADADLDQARTQLGKLERLEPESARTRDLAKLVSRAADYVLP